MKVLVTGGCGFIGSHFIRLLLREHPEARVLNFDLMTYAGRQENVADLAGDYRYNFIQNSIVDAAKVSKIIGFHFDAVINFAAESHVDRSLHGLPTEFVRTNLEGVTILLDAIKRHGSGRFLQVSTDEVYGDVSEGASHEDTPLRPSNPYSVTKAAADQMVLSYVRSFGIDAVITRSANNYGPNQYPEKFIPVVISRAMCNEPIPIYGDGTQMRDWLYVEDNCRAILAVLKRGRTGHVYNVGAGQHQTNLEVAKKILSHLGKSGNLLDFVKDRPGHDRRYSVAWDKIQGELGWSPKTMFDQGLKVTVDWYRREHG